MRFSWAAALVLLAGCSSSPTAPAASTTPPATTTTPPAATTPPPPAPAGEPCTYTLNPTSTTIIASGGTFQFTLTRTAGSCAWTAISDAWIQVSQSSGAGSTTLQATVLANGSPERTGAITITWTSGTAGVQSTRLVVKQNDVIPLLAAGTLAVEPPGAPLASATVVAFSLATKPSGGVPPYRYSWNFGDGTTATAGTADTATHTFADPGAFPVVLTVSDSRPIPGTATTQMTVNVGAVTGTWFVTASRGNLPVFAEPIVLTQTRGLVQGEINDVAGGTPRHFAGPGTISHPRQLNVAVTYTDADGFLFTLTYTGTLDASLSVWTGTVTGANGCPCTFSGRKTSSLAPAGAQLIAVNLP